MGRMIHYSDVLAQAAGASGTAVADLSAAEAALYQQSASRRLRWAWRSAWWPAVCRCEERWFRLGWSAAKAYVAGDEVWSASSGKYWRASQASTNKQPETNAAYWTDVTATMERVIDLDQAGYDAIGDVRDVWQSNPRANRNAIEYRRDQWEMTDGGLLVASTASSVWLRYRVECPKLFGAMFDTDRAYAAGNQVYWEDSESNGNFYDCLMTTTGGETPGSAPTKWRLVEIPACFLSFLMQGMYADYIKRQGQNEKYLAENTAALEALAADAPDEWCRIGMN